MCEEFKGVDSSCKKRAVYSGLVTETTHSTYKKSKMDYKTKDKIFNWCLLALTLAGLAYLIYAWL